MINLKFEKGIDRDVWSSRRGHADSPLNQYVIAIKDMQIGDSFEVYSKRYQLSTQIHGAFKANGYRSSMRSKSPRKTGKEGWIFRFWRIA